MWSAQNKELASSEVVEKPKQKKICCACPETKKERDECIVQNGEPGMLNSSKRLAEKNPTLVLFSDKTKLFSSAFVACKAFIEMHKACLRKEGFDV